MAKARLANVRCFTAHYIESRRLHIQRAGDCASVEQETAAARGCHPCLRYDLSATSGLDRPAAPGSWRSRSKFTAQTARHLLLCRKRFLAKALPEPDLKYRSMLRAVASSATATYERRTAGKYLLVETTRPC
jgi:hypothetical protein